MIRSSFHTTRFSNQGKQERLHDFIDEYRRVATEIVDIVWLYGYDEFNVSEGKLKVPKYLDYNRFAIETDLSGRALSSLVTQLCAVLSASTKKQYKRLEQYKKTPTIQLKKSIHKKCNQVVKPTISNLNPELSSKCADIQIDKTTFDYFLSIKSIGKKWGKINIPLKNHQHGKKLQSGELAGSFLIRKDGINLRWKSEPIVVTEGLTVGADQGFKDVLVLSTEVVTPKTDIHGHSLESIIGTMSRKKKGSNAFGRKQKHRKNFINWSINQLDLRGIKQINLEEVVNIRYKKKSSRRLSHWCNPLIRDKIQSRCEGLGIEVRLQPSAYRSQRCYTCGWVAKRNRKGKVFHCVKCQSVRDADVNAAKNHTVDLPSISVDFRNARFNLKGFYWNPDGLTDEHGAEFRVPLSHRSNSLYDLSIQ